MPEIDTGLGWAAQSGWLTNSAAQVCSLDTLYLDLPGASDQPLPVTGNAPADVAANGKYIFTTSDGFKFYVSASKPGAFVALSQPYSSTNLRYKWQVIAPDSDCLVYTAYQNASSGTITGGQTFTQYDYVTSGSKRWYVFISLSNYVMTDINIPVSSAPYSYSNKDLGYAIASKVVANSTPFNKTNAGYAVMCVAKWKTPNNVTIKTPILISTETDYTDMDTTLTGVYIAKLNILRQGVRFYMSFYDYTGSNDFSTTFPVLDLTSESPKTLEQVFAYIADLDHAAILVLDSPDPYQDENGTSGEAGGGGDSDPDDDPVEEETLPLPSVAGLGFCTIYVPTDTDLMNLAAYLWGGNLDLDNFLRLFANPMDSILGLSVVPVSLSGTSSPIYMGGQLLQNITMPKYTGRTSIKVDMGTTTIEERWGSYLDYDPYTELSLYLPFIGIKNIKADDVMDKTISLMYSIDILSGACVAYIRTSGGSALYEWSGQCALQVPVTGQNWDNIFATAATTAAAIGGALFAPSAVSAGAIASTAVQAIAAKPRVERSGAVNGITGFLGQMRPYLIRVIPQAYIPNEQNKFIGYPSYVTANLGTLTGYNEISSIHLEGIPATGNELAEIETLLKGGVIL